MRSTFEYRKEFGSYAWYTNNNLLYMTPAVAIAYSDPGDAGMTCVHKHGSPELVQQWYDQTIDRYMESGLDHLAGELKIVISDQWPMDELNHILQTSGYLGIYLKRVQNQPFSVTPPDQELVCFTGGAEGSDYTWETAGLKMGWEVQVLSFNGHNIHKLGGGNIVRIPQQYLNVADDWMKQVSQIIHRTFPTRTEYVNNLLRRNYYQVVESSQVVAVGNLNKKHTIVDGGTGWAVQLALLWDKPTYVFDLNTNLWYEYEPWLGIFEETTPPVLAKKFTGIGTRELTFEGVKAIVGCYTRTKTLRGAEYGLVTPEPAI